MYLLKSILYCIFIGINSWYTSFFNCMAYNLRQASLVSVLVLSCLSLLLSESMEHPSQLPGSSVWLTRSINTTRGNVKNWSKSDYAIYTGTESLAGQCHSLSFVWVVKGMVCEGSPRVRFRGNHHF